jgi:hypothetical protein
MGCFIFSSHSSGADVGRFCCRSACSLRCGWISTMCRHFGGCRVQCAVSAQSVARAASFGFRVFRRPVMNASGELLQFQCARSPAQMRIGFGFNRNILRCKCAFDPGANVARFAFGTQPRYLQIQRTRLGELMARCSFVGLRHEAPP